jgi:hypothetical protein
MFRFSPPPRTLVLAATIVGLLGFAPAVGGAAPFDSCSLVTKAEIQEAVGQPVQDGKPNAKANPAVGTPCEYAIAPYGSVSVLWVKSTPGQTAEKTLAEMKKAGMKVSDAPGIGDRSFWMDPGYGMLQLNTWKGSAYLIVTLMVPGATESQQKTAAEKVMKKALTRL